MCFLYVQAFTVIGNRLSSGKNPIWLSRMAIGRKRLGLAFSNLLLPDIKMYTVSAARYSTILLPVDAWPASSRSLAGCHSSILQIRASRPCHGLDGSSSTSRRPPLLVTFGRGMCLSLVNAVVASTEDYVHSWRTGRQKVLGSEICSATH